MSEYDTISKELAAELEQIETLMTGLLALIQLNPETSQEYYECLRILGGKSAWVRGKQAEMKRYKF